MKFVVKNKETARPVSLTDEEKKELAQSVVVCFIGQKDMKSYDVKNLGTGTVVVQVEASAPFILSNNTLRFLNKEVPSRFKGKLNNAKDANLKGNVAQVMFTEVRGSNVELVVAYKCSKESIE